MTRTRIRLDELVIRSMRGAAPSPAQIERAVRDALARELAGAAPAESRRVDHLHVRVGANTGLADVAGATARSVDGSARGSKP